MFKKLGNYSLLIGTLCLVIFFSSSAFLVDEDWFLLGGIGFFALGFLIKRRKKVKRDRRSRYRSGRSKDWEGNDESS